MAFFTGLFPWSLPMETAVQITSWHPTPLSFAPILEDSAFIEIHWPNLSVSCFLLGPLIGYRCWVSGGFKRNCSKCSWELLGAILHNTPLAVWAVFSGTMEAIPQEGSLQVRSSLNNLSPVSKVCSVFTNRDLTLTSEKQPRATWPALTNHWKGGFSCLALKELR